MPSVGFEPTNTNTTDLKSGPLDHSGTRAKVRYQNIDGRIKLR